MLCEQAIHVHCVNLLWIMKMMAIIIVIMTMDDDLGESGGDADIGIDATDQAHADAKKKTLMMAIKMVISEDDDNRNNCSVVPYGGGDEDVVG